MDTGNSQVATGLVWARESMALPSVMAMAMETHGWREDGWMQGWMMGWVYGWTDRRADRQGERDRQREG